MDRSPLFHAINSWLIDRAVGEGELTETIQGLGRKLVAGGLPLYRINVGGLLLHPVLGALDITWEAGNDSCRSQIIPRAAATSPEFRNAPFYAHVSKNIPFERYRLDDPAVRERYPLFETLSKASVTDYVVLFESYGRTTPMDWAGLPSGVEGAIVSFSTRRLGGFTDDEVANLRTLSAPFAVAVKTASDKMLATALLETYLGRISGRNVLAGLVERGDGRVIECALWYSDLRGSTSLAAELDIQAYFSAINDYFDCTAGAVLEHGGEVLKFVGDAVMAIFPFEERSRPASDMCRAAIMTTREAFSRARMRNASRSDQGLAPIEFGVGLHAGSVMYGNVGTEHRLDLTATGPAANEVARLESLCKRLSVPVVSSKRFAKIYSGDLIALGRQEVAGVEEGLEAFTLPEFASPAADAKEDNNEHPVVPFPSNRPDR
jgi:adenylate cyclase